MANYFGLVFLALFGYSNAYKSTDYCHVKSCRNVPNVMCLYKTDKPQCDADSFDINKDIQKTIIDTYQDMKKALADERKKKGSKMGRDVPKDLIWDEELASVGRRMSAMCDSVVHVCPNVERFVVAVAHIKINFTNSTMNLPGSIRKMQQLEGELVMKKFHDLNPKNLVENYKFIFETGRIGCGGLKKRSKTPDISLDCAFEEYPWK